MFFRPDVGQKIQSTGVLIDIRLTRRKLRYQMPWKICRSLLDLSFHCSSFSSKAVKSRSSATSYKLVAVLSSLLYPRTPRSTNRLWRTPAHARLFWLCLQPPELELSPEGPVKCWTLTVCMDAHMSEITIYIDI